NLKTPATRSRRHSSPESSSDRRESFPELCPTAESLLNAFDLMSEAFDPRRQSGERQFSPSEVWCTECKLSIVLAFSRAGNGLKAHFTMLHTRRRLRTPSKDLLKSYEAETRSSRPSSRSAARKSSCGIRDVSGQSVEC